MAQYWAIFKYSSTAIVRTSISRKLNERFWSNLGLFQDPETGLSLTQIVRSVFEILGVRDSRTAILEYGPVLGHFQVMQVRHI